MKFRQSLVWSIAGVFLLLIAGFFGHTAIKAFQNDATLWHSVFWGIGFMIMLGMALYRLIPRVVLEVTPTGIKFKRIFRKDLVLTWQDIEKVVVYSNFHLDPGIYFIIRDINKFPHNPLTRILYMYGSLWVNKEGRMNLPFDYYGEVSREQLRQFAKECSKYVPVIWQ